MVGKICMEKMSIKLIENNEKQSGFTIHYVNEEYDQGDIIFQKSMK